MFVRFGEIGEMFYQACLITFFSVVSDIRQHMPT